ncbi:hypothetical protein EJ05DRAFT_476644 [Pseudovirgaria hyperparasitica]|uniref:Pre-mRNA-splicing factor 38B n=1 Tax=Pseudovirgaria hyperparasitica TaxID=470096 RepID=A0A6A6W492_9PEZI|nr:uncharacterized protein EJ05DRAFT_476644 [Pseudovirgaria hyperparasitica]KAF2757375.1 hypothetical protein EJ05DRAFT_476644 [Pseudovirgaria hyperparasitica]
MPADELDDDTVANLLKEDAKTAGASFGFLSSRPSSQAPKPNTRFLRNIIRETNTHNAALLAREAEESRARLKRLRKDPHPRISGRKIEDVASRDHQSTKRRRHESPDVKDVRSDAHRHGSSSHKRSRRDDREGNDGFRGRDSRRERNEPSDDRRGHRSQRTHRRDRTDKTASDRHRDEKYASSSHDHNKSRRRRSHSKERSRTRSPRRRKRHQSRSRSRTRSQSPSASHHPRISRKKGQLPTEPDSDSDPLEAIVGPMPVSEPTIKSKGRGAYKNSSAMDTHFSKSYDPSADVHINSDLEDDWDMALEALRDRQRWHQQGAERLRSAGFTEDEIRKWEKGGEKTEDDVRWAKKGEGREWDRGKVVDDAGDINVKVEWGRLKGT